MIQKLNAYFLQPTQKPVGELASDEPDCDNAQFGDFSINTWLFEDPDGVPLFVDGAITTERGEVTPIAAVEHVLELHAGSVKHVRTRHMRITTVRGDVLALEGREIGGIPLAALPERFSEANAAQWNEARAAALWLEQHTRFRLGDAHGIAPTPFPYLDPTAQPAEAPAHGR